MDLRKIGETIVTNGIVVILAVACGYLFGTSETAALKNRVTNLEASSGQLAAKVADHRVRLNEARDQLVYLCGNDSQCAARYKMMGSPE